MGRTLSAGQAFAGYQVERLLGVGGMGEVYLARDPDLPRSVALKLLAPGKADDPEVRARFLREADTAARLAHPNIVTVYARGNAEHRLWMAMQYIEGTDVSAVLREGALRPDHAVRIIGETARALDHAHRAGVLHRDVKPANILLEWGPDQRVYLADFGIAKALDQTTGITRTGEMYASFQYAAPEQFELRSDVDRRADVYALGCTLYHMLTGELPYPGESTAQLVAGHLSGPVPRPSERNHAVPSAFDAVIARALAKDREQRYASCGELATAAAQALAAPTHPWSNPGLPVQSSGLPNQDARPAGWDTAPTQASPPPHFVSGPAAAPPIQGSHASPPAVPRRRSRRRWLLSAALVVVVLAAAIGIGFGTGALHFKLGAADAGGGAPAIVAGKDNPSQDAAIKAACDYGQLVNTYDYGNGDGWQAKVLAGATGDWKSQLQGVLPAMRMLLESGTHTRSTGGKCVVTSGSGTHYEFTGNFDLVDTVNGKDANQRSESIGMAMDYVDGRWLCSKMDLPLLPS
ncbi:serine/threonine-protein kinase [Nocardia sp. NPDC088792]|uniref:serine/threonine-protein kinase n=1 Tax=Nocardia sp. NPDC088792 TaxID=3364332 RepID=UPI0038030985